MQHQIVSREEWLVARRQHLAREKELTHARDRLSAERRELPWVRVDKPYRFDGPDGPETLADLFAGRSQLIVYHFMFGPGWEQGCKSCSYLADHFDGAAIHLAQRDVTLAAVSRAPWPEIEAFKRRMGWRFKWVSSYANDFNRDYHVSFTQRRTGQGRGRTTTSSSDRFRSTRRPAPACSTRTEAGEIFHTYSTYARGLDILVGTYNFLDLAPKGRDEDGLPFTMEWVRHHDRYSA